MYRKNSQKNAAANDEDILANLSDSERDAFLKASGKKAGMSVPEGTENQTVSKVKYDTDMAELKAKLKKKDDKITELEKDRETLRDERDTYKNKNETLSGNLASEKGTTARLTKELREANDTIADLRKDLKAKDAVPKETPGKISDTQKKIDKLESERKTLDKDLKEAQEKITNLEADLAGKNATIDTLRETIGKHDDEVKRLEEIIQSKNEEIQRLKERPDLTEEQMSASEGVSITRVSETKLFSETLSDGRYDIKLAKSGRYMLISPNVEGLAVCVEHSIVLPRLQELLPYKGPKAYQMNDVGNNIWRVELVP